MTAFALMVSAQLGLTYEDQLRAAQVAAASGYDAFLRSDHYLSSPGLEGRPTTDAWTVLAGLARETHAIGLGVLVSPVTFRLPGHLAKVISTLDEMSGGRIEVGLGAGWNEREHLAYGIPYPNLSTRATMLTEQLTILRGLWTQPDGWSFAGRHYTIDHSMLRPKPLTSAAREGPGGTGRPRLVVGGEGTIGSMQIAAKWADEYNLTGADASRARDVFNQLDVVCEQVGRAPESLSRSALVPVVVGTNPAELSRRLGKAIGNLSADEAERREWLTVARSWWVVGNPSQVASALRDYELAGVQRVIVHDYIATDIEMISTLGTIIAAL